MRFDNAAMAVLSLFRDAVPTIDASRHMWSPGGYEGWEVTANDPANDLDVGVLFWRGCPYLEKYLQGYSQYRRSPTQYPPPQPNAFSAFTLFLRHRDRDSVCLTLNVGAGLTTEDKPLSVVAGGSVLRRCSDGTLSLQVRGQRDGEPIEIELTFHPRGVAAAVELAVPPDGARYPHHWMVPEPDCEVTGNISFANQTLVFLGTGAYQCRFGTTPAPLYLRRWMWGRGTGGGGSFLFHLAQRAGETSPRIIVLDSSTGAVIGGAEGAPAAITDSSQEGVPGKLVSECGLELSEPRVLGTGTRHKFVAYAGTWRGQATRVLCTWVKTSPDRRLYSAVRGSVAH